MNNNKTLIIIENASLRKSHNASTNIKTNVNEERGEILVIWE